MSSSIVYVLRNKDNGKWFYEEYTEEFHGGSYDKCETLDLNKLMKIERGNYGCWRDLAESWCESHSNRYKLNLEVVGIEISYKEIK